MPVLQRLEPVIDVTHVPVQPSAMRVSGSEGKELVKHLALKAVVMTFNACEIDLLDLRNFVN